MGMIVESSSLWQSFCKSRDISCPIIDNTILFFEGGAKIQVKESQLTKHQHEKVLTKLAYQAYQIDPWHLLTITSL